MDAVQTDEEIERRIEDCAENNWGCLNLPLQSGCSSTTRLESINFGFCDCKLPFGNLTTGTLILYNQIVQ